MFSPRYFAFHYYASRYFPPVGILVGDVLRICTLNMVTYMNSISLVASSGTLNATAGTGSVNMLTRCR